MILFGSLLLRSITNTVNRRYCLIREAYDARRVKVTDILCFDMGSDGQPFAGHRLSGSFLSWEEVTNTDYRQAAAGECVRSQAVGLRHCR